jgi:polyphosphate kinase
MQRNLDRRVETLCSIVDETSRARLEEILKIDLDENGLAWTLDSEGDWHRSPITDGFDTQLRFRELAEVRANRSS